MRHAYSAWSRDNRSTSSRSSPTRTLGKRYQSGVPVRTCRDVDHGWVEPILARIPADGDADARAVLELARDGVTADLLACLNDRDLVALTGYGARHAVIALRQGSATLLRDALLAEAICQVVRNGDDREVMVGLAVFYYVAQQLGLVPSDLFDEVTSCLPDGWIPDLLREFGARQDITLTAFAWQLVQTPDGPDFLSTL